MSKRALDLVLVLVLLVLALAACAEEQVTAPTPSHLEIAAREDVEALIGGSMVGWWRAAHGEYPGPALSTAADAHTSSWRNWGMLDAGAEPRQPPITDPGYRFNFMLAPWEELHRTLASVRDGMLALDAGVDLGDDTRRARAFGSFMQGLALGTLAQLYDRAYILDESVDPAEVGLSDHEAVMAAALGKLDAAVALSEDGSFTVPAEWVGFAADMDADGLARLARSWRARLRISGARTPSERDAVDWNAVLEDVSAGITDDWAGHYDGDWEQNWAYGVDKLWTASQPIWARMDYRTIGPADASGAWVAWINAPPSQRTPFLIDTDDRRITGPTPTSPGTYVDWHEETLFRPQRGRDHFSMYADRRWRHLMDAMGVGDHVDFPVKELDFIRAEALHRTGDRAGAMAIVNEWRAHGELPAFSSPDQTAPGGGRCVPRMPDGSCGDLWEALKYEKRIELFHYGPFTEFLDDRGWGDLVEGTFVELPAPALSLVDMLKDYYAQSSDSAVSELANGVDFESLHRKREGFDRFDEGRASDPGQVGAG